MKKYKNLIIIVFSVIICLVSICFVPFNATKLIPTIEEQVAKDFGVDIHIEKLILRFGPYIKVKAPTMHIMYEDGQKFAQFDNVKFYIHWLGLVKEPIHINKIKANRLIVRINSDDKYLAKVIDKISSRETKSLPDIRIKDYNLSYRNHATGNKYAFIGNSLDINKIKHFDNFKVVTKGNFIINAQKHISYDFSITPYIDFSLNTPPIDIVKIIEQIKEIDFSSDLLADVKLYKNN